jgi:catechol 2,3-dioxygenase-like lactoylglutathione lyase family enzyme
VEPRISLVTLGTRNLERAIRFYRDGLGWPRSSAGGGDVAFFKTGGAVLALYPRHLLAEDAQMDDTEVEDARGGAAGRQFEGITLAHNVGSREQVDAVLAEAVAAGGTLLKAARTAEWGGYSGYFADPDGYPWEVAWNPGFPLAEDGSIQLP